MQKLGISNESVAAGMIQIKATIGDATLIKFWRIFKGQAQMYQNAPMLPALPLIAWSPARSSGP